MRRTWRFRQALRDLVVISSRDATDEERNSALDFPVAAGALRRVLQNEILGPGTGLARLHEMSGQPGGSRLPPSANIHWILDRLQSALLGGRLLVVPRALPTGHGIGLAIPVELDSPPPAEEPVTEEEVKTWIEIELVDQEGNPIPGEPYILTLPDGATVRGSLNSRGLARHDPIPEGACIVTFPGLDGREWKPQA